MWDSILFFGNMLYSLLEINLLCFLKQINEFDAIHALFTSVTANSAECDWQNISEIETTNQGELLASVCMEYTNSLSSIFHWRENSKSFHPEF